MSNQTPGIVGLYTNGDSCNVALPGQAHDEDNETTHAWDQYHEPLLKVNAFHQRSECDLFVGSLYFANLLFAPGGGRVTKHSKYRVHQHL